MKYYVYILKSLSDSKLYIGLTSDLKRRFHDHMYGKVKSTKHRRPLELIHYEFFTSKEDASAREVYLKSGYGHEQIYAMLKNTLS